MNAAVKPPVVRPPKPQWRKWFDGDHFPINRDPNNGYILTGLIGACVVAAGVLTFGHYDQSMRRPDLLLQEVAMLRGVVTVFLGLKIVSWSMRHYEAALNATTTPSQPSTPEPKR